MKLGDAKRGMLVQRETDSLIAVVESKSPALFAGQYQKGVLPLGHNNLQWWNTDCEVREIILEDVLAERDRILDAFKKQRHILACVLQKMVGPENWISLSHTLGSIIYGRFIHAENTERGCRVRLSYKPQE